MKLSQTLLVTAVLTGAGLSATAAMAEMGGSVIKNGSQCWNYSVNGMHNEFGYWEPCPAAAAATVTTRHARHHSKQS